MKSPSRSSSYNHDTYKKEFEEFCTLLDTRALTDPDQIKEQLTKIVLDGKFKTLGYNFRTLSKILNFILNEADINPSVIDKIFERANDIKFLTYPTFKISDMRNLLWLMKEISPRSVHYTVFAQAMLHKITDKILNDEDMANVPGLLHMITTLRAFDADCQMTIDISRDISIENLLAEELPLREVVLQVLDKIRLHENLERLPIEYKTQLLQTQAYFMPEKPFFKFEEVKEQMKKDTSVSKFQQQVRTFIKKIYKTQEISIKEEIVLPLAYAYHSVDILISEFNRFIYIECDGSNHFTPSGERTPQTILRDQINLRAQYHAKQLQQADSTSASEEFKIKNISISINDWERYMTEEEQKEFLTSCIEA